MKSSTNVACRGNPSVVNFVMHIEFVVKEINIEEGIKLKNCLLKRIAIFLNYCNTDVKLIFRYLLN